MFCILLFPFTIIKKNVQIGMKVGGIVPITQSLSFLVIFQVDGRQCPLIRGNLILHFYNRNREVRSGIIFSLFSNI